MLAPKDFLSSLAEIQRRYPHFKVQDISGYDHDLATDVERAAFSVNFHEMRAHLSLVIGEQAPLEYMENWTLASEIEQITEDTRNRKKEILFYMHEVIRLFPEIIQYFEYNGEDFYIESAAGDDEHMGILISTKLRLRIGLDVRNAEVYEDPLGIVGELERRSKISDLTVSTSNRVGGAIK